MVNFSKKKTSIIFISVAVVMLIVGLVTVFADPMGIMQSSTQNKKTYNNTSIEEDSGQNSDLTEQVVNKIDGAQNDESIVSDSKDGITITKSAEWTSYNGMKEDSDGNPYVKINFIVNKKRLSENDEKNNNTADKNIKRKTADIMLVMDRSESMSHRDKLVYAKKACKSFSQRLMSEENVDVRVGFVSFCKKAEVVQNLTSDISILHSAIDRIKWKSGTNIQAGIYEAQKILKKSKADMKYMIVMTDGGSNWFVEEKEPDIATLDSNDKGSGTSQRFEQLVIKQADIAKKQIKGLNIYTVGYDTRHTDETTLKIIDEILSKVASIDEDGNRLYYKAELLDSVSQDLGDVFDTISTSIKKDFEKENSSSSSVDNSIVDLIDTIPSEFELIEESLEKDSNEVAASVSNGGKTITWTYPSNQSAEKIYNMSFIMKLDKTKVSVAEGTTEIDILTNGDSIIGSNSLGSSRIRYGKGMSIGLISPKLKMIISNTTGIKETKINIYNGEEKVKDGKKYRAFYMYFIDSKCQSVENVEFSVNVDNSSEVVEVSFMEDDNMTGISNKNIEHNKIKLYDNTGKRVQTINNKYFVQQNSKYTLVLDKNYMISRTMYGDAGYCIKAGKDDYISTELFRTIRRQAFALH